MKAVVYDAPRSFSVREIPAPVPGPGEVRIRVVQTGLCGTDLHLHEGEFLASYPMIPGHETVGSVELLGEGVTAFELGDLVTVNPNTSCGRCEYCREGRPLQCTDLSGMGSNSPGAFAEYVVAPASQVFAVDDMDPDTAVFAEPASCVAHGIDVIRPRHGSTALIFGAGPTGLLLAQLTRASGVAHVTVADSAAFKLAVAAKLGADCTFHMDRGALADDVTALRALSGGSGFDLVIDATGSAQVAAVAVPLTRDGGTAVFYGVLCEDERIEISPYEIFRRELTIKGSFAEISSFPAAIAALSSGRARTGGIISHRFKLDDYGRALETLRSDPAVHKIVIVP